MVPTWRSDSTAAEPSDPSAARQGWRGDEPGPDQDGPEYG